MNFLESGKSAKEWLKEASDLIGFGAWMEDKLANNKYASKYKGNPTLMDNYIDTEKGRWFEYIFKQAQKGTFISEDILNDVWNIDYQHGSYHYRLFHDAPDINFNPIWVPPKKGEKARGYKKRYKDLPDW